MGNKRRLIRTDVRLFCGGHSFFSYLMAGDEYSGPREDARDSFARRLLQEGGTELVRGGRCRRRRHGRIGDGGRRHLRDAAGRRRAHD